MDISPYPCKTYLCGFDLSAAEDRYGSRSISSGNSCRSLIWKQYVSHPSGYDLTFRNLVVQSLTLTVVSRIMSNSKRFSCKCSTGGKLSNITPFLASCKPKPSAIYLLSPSSVSSVIYSLKDSSKLLQPFTFSCISTKNHHRLTIIRTNIEYHLDVNTCHSSPPREMIHNPH